MLADLAVVTLLASIALTAVVALRSRTAAVALALQSLAWLSVNGVAEGPVLLRLGADHGVVMADLLTVVGLIFAAVAFVRSSRDEDRSESRALR